MAADLIFIATEIGQYLGENVWTEHIYSYAKDVWICDRLTEALVECFNNNEVFLHCDYLLDRQTVNGVSEPVHAFNNCEIRPIQGMEV